MAGHLKGRHIKASNGDNSKADWSYSASVAVSADEILQPVGVVGSKLSMALADASAAATATGRLFIANQDAASGSVGGSMSPMRLVGPVNTNSFSAVGSAVFLSDTAGAIATSAGTVSRVIGHVVVKDATNGYWLFDGSVGTTVPA